MTSITDNQATEVIYARILANLPAGWTDAQVTFHDEPYTPPQDDPWLRLTVFHEASAQITLGRTGARRYDRTGTVVIQVFDKSGNAVSDINAIVNHLQTVYEGVRDSGVVLLNSDRQHIGIDGRWDQTNFSVQFYHEEIK